jgi:NAD(P)-dependent dehydrogenase (short-subunit alcohol dehydrogenase family)
MNRIKGAVCVVTGASSGIGQAIAHALAEEGGHVYGLDLREDRDRASGTSFVQADVTDLESLRSAAAEVLAAEGTVDVLVTSAGIWRPATVTSDDAVAVWDSVMNVNLRGTFLTSHVFVPPMLAQGHGSVVHISSISGLIGNQGSSAYSASKGAVISLTKSMALDYGVSGVRVNCVCPGIVRTPLLTATESTMTPDEIAAANKSRVGKIPVGRVGEPRDIAAAVLFLASSESEWTTGTALTVDGGYLAGR